MQNEHVQEAIRNMQRALNDATIKQQELRNNAENHKRELDRRITDLKQQQVRIQSDMISMDQPQDKATAAARMGAIQTQVKQAEQERFQAEDAARREIAMYDQQMFQIKDITQQLQTMS